MMELIAASATVALIVGTVLGYALRAVTHTCTHEDGTAGRHRAHEPWSGLPNDHAQVIDLGDVAAYRKFTAGVPINDPITSTYTDDSKSTTGGES